VDATGFPLVTQAPRSGNAFHKTRILLFTHTALLFTQYAKEAIT
jgi:hypothetical protein